MKPHATLAAWQRLPTARERRAHQLVMCRSGAHADLTSTGCGLFQRRCSVCEQLFEMEADRWEPDRGSSVPARREVHGASEAVKGWPAASSVPEGRPNQAQRFSAGKVEERTIQSRRDG